MLAEVSVDIKIVHVWHTIILLLTINKQVINENENNDFIEAPSFTLETKLLDLYGLSLNSKYFYIIENKKFLKLFRTSDFKNIGEMVLYYFCDLAICSNDYLSISLQDKKVISFLIVDPKAPDNLKKIKQLKSR